MSADEGLLIGRRIKAKRIAAAIAHLGGGVAEAKRLSDAEWIMADLVSKRKGAEHIVIRPDAKVPSPETRALVLEYLAQWPRDEDAPDNNR